MLKFNCIERNDMAVNVTPEVLEEMKQQSSVKKRGRPRKKDKEETALAVAVDSKVEKVQANTIMTSDTPVIDKYKDTTAQLQHSVLQLDQLASELKQELDTVRHMKSASLTAKTKYDAIGGLGSTIGNLIRGKIDAIKEINKSITDSNNIELKRYKELGDRNAERSSEERMMDMYNAYINMPIGQYPQFPNSVDATTGITPSIPMISNNGVYTAAVTPEMNRVLMEGNPNINTVVVNDPSTGEYHFDVIDRSSGQSIPNYPRPSNMILEGLTFNPNNNTAVNKDLNIEYDVINRPSNSIEFVDPNTAQVMEDMRTDEPVEKKPKPISKIIKDNF